MRHLLGLLIVGGLVALGGCQARGCAGTERRGPPDLSRAADGFTEPVAAAYELQLTHLAALATSGEEISLAARRRGGRLVYLRLSATRFQVEEVTPGALPGRPALGLTAAGAPVIAAITAPTIGEKARIPPPPEAPREAVDGEGALRLLHRRGEELWRGELLADRALEVQMAVSPEGAIHLVFLQPYGKLFQVNYLKVEGAALGREIVGLSPKVAPALVLRDGLPVVAHATETGGLAVSTGREGGGFDPMPVGEASLTRRVLAFDLVEEEEAASLALLVSTKNPAPDEPVALHHRSLKNPLPAAEAKKRVRPRGTFPRSAIGSLSAGPRGAWLMQSAKTTYFGDATEAVRVPQLREAVLLHAGPYRIIGLDLDGRLRVGR
ncbi:MAG: hypothetical protein P1V51_23670 [Deltaproteobacteria bacterium]|nr:hypothetical protein [Deltaproteobacteria bacterium]